MKQKEQSQFVHYFIKHSQESHGMLTKVFLPLFRAFFKSSFIGELDGGKGQAKFWVWLQIHLILRDWWGMEI